MPRDEGARSEIRGIPRTEKKAFSHLLKLTRIALCVEIHQATGTHR